MSAGSAYPPTARTVPTRYRDRARYDRATVHGILDEALICHVGYLNGGRPVVLPTTHARLGEILYLHGSTGSGPMDDAEDVALPHWAGVVPLTLNAGTPIPADDLDPAVPLPPYLTPYRPS